MTRMVFINKRQLELINSVLTNDVTIDELREISDEKIQFIINELSNKFASEGLNENYEPNQLGSKIEDAIDFFNSANFYGDNLDAALFFTSELDYINKITNEKISYEEFSSLSKQKCIFIREKLDNFQRSLEQKGVSTDDLKDRIEYIISMFG